MARLQAPLRSSAITRVEYDTDSQELLVTFPDGRTYSHIGVPQEVYDGLVNAPSAGRYYHAVIKGVYG
jgi:hypothetical protein